MTLALGQRITPPTTPLPQTPSWWGGAGCPYWRTTPRTLQRDSAPSAITHAAWECRLHWARQVPLTNRVDYAIFVGHAGASLQRQEVWHRWSAEADDSAGVTRTVTALHWSEHWIMRTSLSWIRMTDTLNTLFT